MITRPLDLASKLRPEPRTLYWLFFVNAGMLVLFFSVLGSRFVLAPGLGVDFRLPEVAGANAHARPPTHVISVMRSGEILTNDGKRTMDTLGPWLKDQAATVSSPLLLVRMDAGSPMSVLTEISSLANRAGFQVLLAASEPAAGGREGVLEG